MTDHHTTERQAFIADTRLAEARMRFGRPFAHERGSTYCVPSVPVLTAWLVNRQLERRPK